MTKLLRGALKEMNHLLREVLKELDQTSTIYAEIKEYLDSLNNLNKDDFTRVNSDSNGNPRFVVHFLQCCPESWKGESWKGTAKVYEKVCKLMNKIGGKRFHNKQYGGGIVFQTYSLTETIADIERIKATI